MAIDSKNCKPLRACFSYAAYSKNLIDYLKSFNIPIEKGLTDLEFSSIESILTFKFPPDLRSVLREGLPVGPGFPNWRSTSTEQLQILTNLPIINLCKEISRKCFWQNSWGERPKDSDEAVNLGKGFLKDAPVLVPVYRNFYIPAVPFLAGNPVFYVNGGDVRLWSFDIAGFFHQVELREDELRRPTLSKLLGVPAWAATEPRRIEFWTDLAEKPAAGGSGCRGWWSNDYFGGLLEYVFWRLRKGGWKEEEVREMMMMDGGDEIPAGNGGAALILNRECVVRHVEILSKRLLRAGWSSEDVMESLGSSSDHDEIDQEEESWFDCQQAICDDDHSEVISLGTEIMNNYPVKV